MTVTQVGRTSNSVTTNVSGITEGDRQTYVWIVKSNVGNWYTLQEAKANGYISDFYVANLVDNNGDITIVCNKNYTPYKVVHIRVTNVNTSTTDKAIQIKTILEFEYDNSFPKHSGDDIDITVSDLRDINLFGSNIDTLIGDGDGTYYSLTDVGVGDLIYAVYLNTPAEHILNAAIVEPDLIGESYSTVWRCARNIANNCVSGADFKAQFFNDIADAINNFNLTCTI